jgi:hypothetical protein
MLEGKIAGALGALLLGTSTLVAACGGGAVGGVCGEAADVSSDCGGLRVTSAGEATCQARVAKACTAAEQAAYADYLACADQRCLTASPDRQIGPSCDHLLDAVSASCFAAGVTGNSDYRYCAGGADTCRAGTACDASTGTCQPG